MSARLDDKTAVVTGAASGIGAAIARRVVAEGGRVVLADIQTGPTEALAAELGTEVAVAATTDVSVEDHVAAAVDLAVDRFGRLDIMVNNAGIVGVLGPVCETPADAWDRTVGILLRGVFLGMKHAARVMTPQRSGSIVSIASTAGVQGGLGPHCYTACKHAVVGLTKSVATELGPLGIRVNAVAPGNTATAMTASFITGDHRAIGEVTEAIASISLLKESGLPEDIADATIYLAGDQSRMITGHTLVVDAGQTINGGSNRVHRQPVAVLREAGQREDV